MVCHEATESALVHAGRYKSFGRQDLVQVMGLADLVPGGAKEQCFPCDLHGVTGFIEGHRALFRPFFCVPLG